MSKEKLAELLEKGWEPDLFSTFLSRKHSLHLCIGNMRFVKPKPRKNNAE